MPHTPQTVQVTITDVKGHVLERFEVLAGGPTPVALSRAVKGVIDRQFIATDSNPAR